ncbi:MAG: VanW family protein [Bacillota bacterium]|nr:VanW family protein [Bacillota bacterium]
MKRLLCISILLLLMVFNGCTNRSYEDQKQMTDNAPKKENTTAENNTNTENGGNGNNNAGTENQNKAAAKEEVISTFETPLKNASKTRVNNLKIASDAINGKVIKSGETFSFNDTVGATTKEKGYQKATIFNHGEKEKGYGGGICQISTTLYNAAQGAKMEIVERHEHSVDVDYIEKGKDATVAYGGLDLKFKNTLGYPVKLETAVEANRVLVNIYIIK